MTILRQKAKILDVRKDSHDVSTFTLEVEKEINFKPGQAVTLIIGNARAAYSISSSPSNTKMIQITAKYHEDGHFSPFLYKKGLGDEIEFIGPYGHFILKDNEAEEYYFVAGGVGVTPFRSMIFHSVGKNLPSKLNLLYSAKTESEILYKEEFLKLKKEGKLTNYFTLTREEKETHESGRLTKDTLQEQIKNKSAIFYICGPPEFVTDVEVALIDIGIERHKIRKEKWIA